MKNKEVVEDFIRGRWIDSKGSNLFSEGNILYSYGRHFPIAVRLKDCWVVNNRTYSPTTSAHQGHFTRALGFKNLKSMFGLQNVTFPSKFGIPFRSLGSLSDILSSAKTKYPVKSS